MWRERTAGFVETVLGATGLSESAVVDSRLPYFIPRFCDRTWVFWMLACVRPNMRAKLHNGGIGVRDGEALILAPKKRSDMYCL